MTLKEKILKAGCSEEFADICELYKEFYIEGSDLELFIELVEKKHAIVEAQEYDEALIKKAKKAAEMIEMQNIFNKDENI